MKRLNKLSNALLLTGSVLFLIVFFYIPIVLVIYKSFSYDGGFSVQALREILTSPWQLRVIFFTIRQAFYSSILSLLFGLPLAWMFGRYSFYGKYFMKSLFLVPFILPGITVALGFILFYGNNGFINQFLGRFGFNIRVLYSLRAILMAHIFYNIPIVIRVVGNTIEKFNKRLEQAGECLGANKFQLWTRLFIPCLTPSILNAGLLVFIYCFMTFGIVLVLGDVSYTTIEVNIFILVRQLMNLRLGMALGLVQIILSLSFLLVSRAVQNQYNYYLSYIYDEQREQASLWSAGLLNLVGKVVYFFFALLFVISPIVSIFVYFIHNSSWGNSFSFFAYDAVIASTKAIVLLNSTLLAFTSAFLCTVISFCLALGIYRSSRFKFLEVIAFMPMGISSVTFGLGFILFQRYFPFNRFSLLIIAHTIISFPLVFKIIYDGLKHIKVSYLSAGECLGAKPRQIMYKIILPLMLNCLFTGFIFAFALSLGELGAASVLQRNFVTIPLAIYRYLSARQFISATGMSLLLVFTALASFYVSEILKTRFERLTNDRSA